MKQVIENTGKLDVARDSFRVGVKFSKPGGARFCGNAGINVALKPGLGSLNFPPSISLYIT